MASLSSSILISYSIQMHFRGRPDLMAALLAVAAAVVLAASTSEAASLGIFQP